MRVFLVFVLCLLFLGVNGQTVRISVLDIDSKKKLIGVSVQEANGKFFGKTDSLGNIEIPLIDTQSLLEFTHIGYSQKKVFLKDILKNHIITMNEVVKVLDEIEIINTGYQELPKERVTGAFEFINNGLFNSKSGSDVLSRLDNIVPGLLFDRRNQSSDMVSASERNILIRGLGTLSEDIKAPLIVLDNFPYGGNIEDINPNDIESITVLKDAAAASIWGAQAGNGVIVLTSKKASKGFPLKVVFNSNLRVNKKPNLFKYDRMSVEDYIEVEQYLFNNGFYNALLNNRTSFPALTPVIELLDGYNRNIISKAEFEEKLQFYKESDFRRDYEKYFYRTNINYQNHFSVLGSSDRHSYNFSFGADNNKNALVGNNSDRYTIKTNNSYQLTPLLKLDLSTLFIHNQSTSNSPGDYTSLQYSVGKMVYPYASIFNQDGTLSNLIKTYRASYIDTTGTDYLLDWRYNPLTELKNANNRMIGNSVNLNMALNYKLTQDLQMDFKYQFENITNTTNEVRSEEMFYTRDLINQFTNLEGGKIKYNLPRGSIIDKGVEQIESHSIRAQADYKKRFNDESDFTILVGSEVRDFKTNGNSFRYLGVNENTLGYSTVDHLSVFTKWQKLGSARIPSYGNLFGNIDRFVSFYANGSYSFKNKYTVSGSGRRDASNLYGASANNKWKPLWSVGGKWNISEESFINIESLDLLNLRITYGVSGNTNNTISSVPILNMRNPSSSIINQTEAIILSPGNEHLSWESIYMTNLGLDFSFFKNRLKGSLDIYNKISKDLITGMEVDLTTGLAAVNANSGEMVGKGVDLSLSGIILNNKVFNWNSTIIFSYNDFKISNLKYDFSNTQGSTATFGNGTSIRLNNDQKNPYGIYSFYWAGLNSDGQPVGYLNGESSTDYRSIMSNTMIGDVKYHGSGLPIYYGAFRNSFKWKNLDLSFNISYKLGYYFRKSALSYVQLFNNGIGTSDFNKRWQKIGDELTTNIPVMEYPLNSLRDQFFTRTSANVLRADNIRLEDVNIGYSFKNHLLDKLFIKNMKVYANISRVGIIWKATSEKLDPDFNTGNAIYPPSRHITFGFNLDF